MTKAQDKLIADIRKRRSAVTAKIARIRRVSGMEIAGTSEDPRLDLKAVTRLSPSQLKNYYRELNAFMSRGVAFVAGDKNVPLPKAEVAKMLSLQATFHKIADKHLEGVGKIFIDSAGMTVAQREATFKADTLRAEGDIINKPFSKRTYKASDITSVDALKVIVKDLERRNAKDYLPGELAKSREQLNDMLDIIGDTGLKTKMAGLSNSQFDVMWNYTNFATNVSLLYEIFKLKATGKSNSDRWIESVAEDTVGEINELGDWASKLPKSTPKNKSAKS